jgi:hypothetical protein
MGYDVKKLNIILAFIFFGGYLYTVLLSAGVAMLSRN